MIVGFVGSVILSTLIARLLSAVLLRLLRMEPPPYPWTASFIGAFLGTAFFRLI